MRTLFHLAAVAVATMLLASCGSVRPTPKQNIAAIAPCDTVSASGTTYGQFRARQFAEKSLRFQIADLRGDLVSSGLRRVRVIAKRTTCRPYNVFGAGTSLTNCVAEARLCGR